jgi:hypothetical protein
VSLDARQLLRLFAPIHLKEIKSDAVTETGMLYLHACVHKAGHLSTNKGNNKKKRKHEPQTMLYRGFGSGTRIKTAVLLERNGVPIKLNLPVCKRPGISSMLKNKGR